MSIGENAVVSHTQATLPKDLLSLRASLTNQFLLSILGILHITIKVVDTFCRDAGIPASIYVSRHFAWERRTPVRQL